MKTTTLMAGAVALMAMVLSAAAQPALQEVAFNAGGTVNDTLRSGAFPLGGPIDPITAPAGVTLAGFNTTTGLGTINYTITGAGNSFFDVFFDIEADLANGPFSEAGSIVGAPASGQHWEIGDPGDPSGIYNDFANHTLTDANSLTPPGDVSVALGYDFTLGAGDTAYIDVNVGLNAPGSGPYLVQENQNSGAKVYYWSSLRTLNGQPGVPDSGTTLSALAMALSALAGFKYRFGRNN